jgi:hypothetical protein
MSTTHSYSTTFHKSIVYDPETRDHAMHLDGSLVGFARTHQEAEITLDQLVSILRTGGTLITAALTRDLPHLSTDAIAEALGVLAAHDDDGAIYALAARHLAEGVTVGADGHDRLINGVLVRRAPLLERWPWPWRCACGEERCWHGALLEGMLLGWERLGDDPRPLPFEEAA